MSKKIYRIENGIMYEVVETPVQKMKMSPMYECSGKVVGFTLSPTETSKQGVKTISSLYLSNAGGYIVSAIPFLNLNVIWNVSEDPTTKSLIKAPEFISNEKSVIREVPLSNMGVIAVLVTKLNATQDNPDSWVYFNQYIQDKDSNLIGLLYPSVRLMPLNNVHNTSGLLCASGFTLPGIDSSIVGSEWTYHYSKLWELTSGLSRYNQDYGTDGDIIRKWYKLYTSGDGEFVDKWLPPEDLGNALLPSSNLISVQVANAFVRDREEDIRRSLPGLSDISFLDYLNNVSMYVRHEHVLEEKENTNDCIGTN